MNFKEQIKPTGVFRFRILNADGSLHQEIIKTNLVTNTGKARLAAALAGTAAAIAFQQLGTGTTAPAYTDTSLQTPNAGTKKAIYSVASSGSVVSVTASWAAGEATGTWKEFGLLFADNTLWNRVAIDITVASDKALIIDGEITIS